MAAAKYEFCETNLEKELEYVEHSKRVPIGGNINKKKE